MTSTKHLGRIIAGFLICTFSCVAADWEKEIRALRPADTAAQETAVLDEVQQRAKQALDAIPHAHTKDDAERTRPLLRQKLEHSLGFRQFPWPPDLQARVIGAIQRDGYHIEKIVYQTLPGTLVAAHVYMPDVLSRPAPAILFYNGHWWPDAKTRPDFQAFCINMARLGFVVLTFDPFGQGERGISTRDHRRVESLLVGVAQQGIAEYESQCALAYLLSRKEVDPQRIGMTGASGGGYNTWITSALDDRIKVAVPVVATSDFYEQIAVTRPLDWYHAAEHCHFVPGLIRYANNHEFAAMVAPRPLLIIAASQDQSFPIEGVLVAKAEPVPSEPLRGLPPVQIPLLRSLRLQRVLIPSGKITLPAFYLAAPPETGVLVAVDDRGKEELAADPLIREAAARGWSICGIDPRGIGESATTQKGWLAATSLLLNEDFVLRQGEDIAHVIHGFPGKRVALYARGDNAALAAAYAIAIAPDIAWYALRDGFLTFRQFLDRPRSLQTSFQLKREDKDCNSPYDHEIPFSYVSFDGLRKPDIPQMLAATGAQCVIVNPVDGDWNRMAAEAAQKLVHCPVISSDSYEGCVRSFVNSF